MFEFSPFPQLKTSNLVLRKIASQDEDKIFILKSHEDVLRFQGNLPVKSMSDIRKFIDRILNGIEDNQWIHWAITKESTMVGTICLWNLDKENRTADIGFELLPQFQGQGIMQEAVPVVLQYGFKTMKLKTIYAVTNPENQRSVNLLLRNGFNIEKSFTEKRQRGGQNVLMSLYIKKAGD